MNRGSRLPATTLAGRLDCFNEAPIHESGKSSRSVRSHGFKACFNEAPIHESGKSVYYGLGLLFIPSFNEAPIHESGKCPSGKASIPSQHLLQ